MAGCLTQAGVRDVAQLAGMSDMEVRRASGLNLGAARKFHVACKAEVQRRAMDAAAMAAARAAAEQAAIDAEMGRVAGTLKDEELIQMLSSNGMLVEVGDILIEEDLLTRADLLGLTTKDYIELGIDPAIATKLEHLLAERARRQRPTRGALGSGVHD
jgi:hypothetical protein